MKGPILITSLIMGFFMNLFGGRANAQNEAEWPEGGSYSKSDTTKFYPPFSKDSLTGIYFETAKYMWENFVPKSGQAETVQGELIRASERLDHEIRDNGKGNWNKQFVMLGDYLRKTLVGSKAFPKDVEREIEHDIRLITRSASEVVTDDEVYARITRRIVEWYWRHKEPIRHQHNPKLRL